MFLDTFSKLILIFILAFHTSSARATLLSALARSLRLFVSPDIRRHDYTRHTTLHDLAITAQTGDIVLCSGEKHYQSDIIRLVTRTPFSHVAMLYRPPHAPSPPLLWQSLRPGSGFTDYDIGAAAVGPTLTNATLYLSGYAQTTGQCIVRRLHGRGTHRVASITRAIEDLSDPRRAYRHTGYPAYVPGTYINHLIERAGFRAALDIPGTLCSSLVAQTLMDAGIMSPAPGPTHYVPGSYVSGKNIFAKNVYEGVYYGEAELIVV